MNIATILQSNLFHIVHDPINLNQINDDFYIYNDIRAMPLYDIPTRLENTVISICLDGYTRVSINLREYFIGPGTMMIAVPDQIIQSLEVSDKYQGVIIVISRDYTDNIFSKVEVMLPIFFYTKEYPCINIKGEELNGIMEYYNILWRKTKKECGSKDVIQTLLVALLYEIYAIYHHRIPRKKEARNRKEMLYDQFMRSLSENYKKERSVNFYAKELFLTPKHLSSVVKGISGKTVGEWIDIFVLFEAKSLLKSSQKNIQEIADELNFANQSFFGKYFKRYTGMSPKAFRRK
ncbi:MAG: helix-turn-helix domain-containing protein [Mediterranea sp.]|jgi:AraC-like DNA-binding protein|nr:helix-turn-helix domain-containing protein [Mediterranea sp.]